MEMKCIFFLMFWLESNCFVTSITMHQSHAGILLTIFLGVFFFGTKGNFCNSNTITVCLCEEFTQFFLISSKTRPANVHFIGSNDTVT